MFAKAKYIKCIKVLMPHGSYFPAVLDLNALSAYILSTQYYMHGDRGETGRKDTACPNLACCHVMPAGRRLTAIVASHQCRQYK